MKKSFLILSILLVCNISNAQFFDFGQDPAKTNWRNIRTQNYKIIFPDSYQENIDYIKYLFDKLYSHTNSLYHKPEFMNMILHTKGGISNGSVGWAPKKCDLYAASPPHPSTPWIHQLCTHEFRHIVQIDKIKQGFSKSLYYIFGEQAIMAIVGMYIPMWFMEGDAVGFETATSKFGRGREPDFLNQVKAQIMEVGIYSYDKAVLGSYKDFVPNRYPLGYYLTNRAKINYGAEIWADMLKNIGKHPLSITPFSTSIKNTFTDKRKKLWSSDRFRTLMEDPQNIMKKNTYKDAKKTLYYDVLTEQYYIWKQNKTTEDKIDKIKTNNRYYTNYYYPQVVSGDSSTVISFKKGMNETGSFVYIRSNGDESIITSTGNLIDYKFATDGNIILWTEYHQDKRWEHGGKNGLSYFNIRTGEYKKIKADINRYSPFATKDGWGFVEIDENDNSKIIVVDKYFRTTKTFYAAKGEKFIQPYYRNDSIVFVNQKMNGIELSMLNTKTNKIKTIIKTKDYLIEHPIISDIGIIFQASFNANNAVYLIRNGKIKNILNTKYGTNFLTLNHNKLLFSYYTHKGYKLGYVNINNVKERPVTYNEFEIASKITSMEDWNFEEDIKNHKSTHHAKTHSYSKIGNLFNIHSWGPSIGDTEDLSSGIGIGINSHNPLSTLMFSAGYYLNNEYPEGIFRLKGQYKALYPIFSFDIQSGRIKRNLKINASSPLTINNVDILNTRMSLQAMFPFNLSKGNINRQLNLNLRYKLNILSIRNNFEALLPKAYNPKRIFNVFETSLSFYNLRKTTEVEISPKWGYHLNLGHYLLLKDSETLPNWWMQSSFYIPGFANLHSFNLRGGFQSFKKIDTYIESRIRMPRGMFLRGDKILSLGATYTLPLLYPEIGLGSIIYSKRIRGAIFFDKGYEFYGQSMNSMNSFYSAGIELSSDSNILRLLLPVELGIRVGYENKTNSIFTNLLLNIILSF